jgi:hypothetical protein
LLTRTHAHTRSPIELNDWCWRIKCAFSIVCDQNERTNTPPTSATPAIFFKCLMFSKRRFTI